MIPYEELVSALIDWRTRQGLPTGQTDYLGEPRPMPLTGPPQPEPAQYGYAEEEGYAELADSDLISEEPDEEPGPEYAEQDAVSFPDTEAVEAAAGMYPESAPPAAAAYAADDDVTEFSPPPEEAVAQAPSPEDDREFAEVMEVAEPPEVGVETWDTAADAAAIPPEQVPPQGEQQQFEDAQYDAAGLHEQPEAMPGDVDQVPAPSDDTTMDVDPESIVSEDDLPPAVAEAGEIGMAQDPGLAPAPDDPFAEPPPLAPPPGGEDAAVEQMPVESPFDSSSEPDPDKL